MRVALEAVQYLGNPQPGVVEAYLTDARGFRWQVVEKTVMFHEWSELNAETTFPRTVSLECRISSDHGGPTISIWLPEVSDRTYEVPRDDIS